MLGSRKKARFNDPDSVNYLPDEIFTIILSFLPLDEAVRARLASKRLYKAGRNTRHLDLDERLMYNPLSQPLISPPTDHLYSIYGYRQDEGIYRYHRIVSRLLQKHKKGSLQSCKLTHCPQHDMQITLGVLFACHPTIDKLSLKCFPVPPIEKVQNLSRTDAYEIFSPLSSLEIVNYYIGSCSAYFRDCIKLKILKLERVGMKDETLDKILSYCCNLESLSLVSCPEQKNTKIHHENLKFLELRALSVIELDVSVPRLEVLDLSSLTCPKPSKLKIIAPRLRVFQSHCRPLSKEGLTIRKGNFVLKMHEILLQTVPVPHEIPKSNIFGAAISSLMIALDLKSKKATQKLSFVMICCVNLKTLSITTPDSRMSKINVDDYNLQYPMLWERIDVCHCVNQTLKFVLIDGFTCHQLEAEFVKHLITRASNMQEITIVWRTSMTETVSFLVPLQDQKASANLSILINVNSKDKSTLVYLNQFLNIM